MIEKQNLSRRSFLAGAGIVTGAAIVAAGTGLINPKSAEAAFSALPWAYAPSPGLIGADLDLVKRRGHDYYATSGGCMAGTGKALIVTIMEKLTGDAYAAWDSFPQDLFTYGGGGINSGWGTICGSLHGAAYVISACAPNGTVATNLINDLYQWYCGFNFPSTDHDAYDPYPGQARTVCNSPLCHASVSTWCKATGTKVSAAERGKRCAKVAGDCAGKAAELLNSYFYGTYASTFVQPDTSCSGCHVTAGTEKWVQGKATCNTCHGTGKNTVKPSGSTCIRP